MTGWIASLLELGVRDEERPCVVRWIRVTNGAAVSLVGLSLCFSLLLWWIGVPRLVVVPLATLGAALGTLALDALGKVRIGRAFLLVAVNATMFVTSLALGRDAGAYLVFLVPAATVSLVFTREERWQAAVVALAALGLMVVAYVSSNGAPPMLALSPQATHSLHLGFLLVTAAAVGLNLLHFKVASERMEEQLRLADRKARERLNEALRESEGRYAQLVRQAADALIVFDQNGLIQELNGAALHRLGGTSQDYVGRHVGVIVDDLHENALPSLLQQLHERGEASAEHTFRRQDGKALAMEAHLGLVRLRGKEQVLAVARDVSERKAMHARLALANRRAAIGTLAAGVAHEINNPLTAVTMNADLAKEILKARGPALEAERERVLSAVDQIAEGAERVRRIVCDLMSVAKAHEGTPRAIDLRQIVQRTVGLAAAQLEGVAEVRVEEREAGHPVVVRADEARTGQILLNLLLNAGNALTEVDHGERSIMVRLQRMGPRWTAVEVIDNGPGMPPEILARVCEPFFTTRHESGGSGLGLYMVKSMVEAMGGELHIESQPGKGTTVRVLLEVAKSVVQTEPAARGPHRTPDPQTTPAG